jgi:hypothetical protein
MCINTPKYPFIVKFTVKGMILGPTLHAQRMFEKKKRLFFFQLPLKTKKHKNDNRQLAARKKCFSKDRAEARPLSF